MHLQTSQSLQTLPVQSISDLACVEWRTLKPARSNSWGLGWIVHQNRGPAGGREEPAECIWNGSTSSHLNTWSQLVPLFGEVAEPSGSPRMARESSSLVPFHFFLPPVHSEETALLSIPPSLWFIETQWSQVTMSFNLCNPEPKDIPSF